MTPTKGCKLIAGTCAFQGREPCEDQVCSSSHRCLSSGCEILGGIRMGL